MPAFTIFTFGLFDCIYAWKVNSRSSAIECFRPLKAEFEGTFPVVLTAASHAAHQHDGHDVPNFPSHVFPGAITERNLLSNVAVSVKLPGPITSTHASRLALAVVFRFDVFSLSTRFRLLNKRKSRRSGLWHFAD